MSLHLIMGCMYSGKCYYPSTEIIKSDFNKIKIYNVKEGEYLLGRDSKPKKVLSVTRYRSPCYTIIIKDCDQFTVSENHQVTLWDTQTDKYVELPAFELFTKFYQDKDRYHHVMCPRVSGSQEKFNSYIIGCFLSNRSDLDLNKLSHIEPISFKKFYEVTRLSHTYINPFIKSLDFEGRRNFCEGLFDGFGKKNIWTFKDYYVAIEVCEILWSIGVPNKLRNVHSRTMYRVIIIEGEFKPKKHEYHLPIEKIVESTNSLETIGLEVEDEYLILDKYILGHNSSQLIHEISKYQGIKEHVFCINSIYDDRHHEDVIMTHDGVTIDCCKVEKLEDAHIPYSTQVIGIDEAQFFPDLISFVKDKLSKGFTLIVAGLDGDYRQQKFGNILDLVPLADTYQKKYALCNYCQNGTPGVFTRRLVQDDSQILVGARDKYVAVCRSCYERPIEELLRFKKGPYN